MTVRAPCPPRPLPLSRDLALAVLAVLASTSALAQKSPYYLGTSLGISHDSNLYRIADDAALTGTAVSRSDTLTSIALVAGMDQTFGRQRGIAELSLRNNRYQSNSKLDYNGYGLKLGLDWQTINNLSGTLGVNAGRSLQRADSTSSGTLVSQQYLKRDQTLNATVRLGVATRMTAEATLVQARTSYADAAYDAGNATRQTVTSAGLRYQLGGATTVGGAWRHTQVRYPGQSSSDYRRDDLDATVSWTPSGLTNVYGRLSSSRQRHSPQRSDDFTGLTWELRGTSQVSGKVKLGTTLSRDTGGSLSTVTYTALSSSTGNFSRTSTGMRLDATWDISAKMALRSALDLTRRDLSPLDGTSTSSGSDTTQVFSLGLDWNPTRSIALGCDLSRESRTVSSNVSFPYRANVFGCTGRFVLNK